MRDLGFQASRLLTLALLGAGCCLSVGTEDIAGATNAGLGTSGQGSSGQGSGRQTSNGGSATAGACDNRFSLLAIPNVVDFGSTLINTVAKRSVVLENCSTAPVTGITATVIGGDDNLFEVDNAPETLGAGATATVDISYAPLALETRSLASVQFSGSDGEKTTLNLFGEPIDMGLLTVQPNPCDFGFVALGTAAVCCTTVTDQSNVTVNITGVTNFANEGGAYALATTDDATPPNPFSLPVAVPGGGSAEVCFSFTPTISQQYSGQVTLITDDPGDPNPTIQLTGWGGGPQINCTPLSVDFGQTRVFEVSTVPIICTNIGSAIPATNLVISPPTVSPNVFQTQFDQNSDIYPLNGLAPGESAQIDVSYAPTTTSNDKGTLFIKNNGALGQTLQIPVSGQGLNVPPCQFEIAPTSLDFGNQQVGNTLSLAFDVTNAGPDLCLVDGPRISNDAAGAFRIVSISVQPDPTTGKITILASSSVTVTIVFSPTSTGAFSAEISDPSGPNQAVEFTGTSEDTCLQIAPTSLDFGQLGVNDAGVIYTSQTKSFAVSNQCRTTASIEAIKTQNGPGDLVAQYSRPAGPTLPVSLSAGAQASFALDCQPTSTGQHPAQVLVSDGTVEVLLPLTCDAQ